MDDNAKVAVSIAFFSFLALAVMMMAAVRGCDDSRMETINQQDSIKAQRVECLRAGRDPLACDKLGRY